MALLKMIECSVEERKFIIDNINTYNLGEVPASISEIWIPFEHVIKNEEGEVIAGIIAGLGCWGGLEIKIVWVMEGQRQSGIGTKLLIETEKKAKSKGATIALLDTFDFQAKDFYLKNGYTVFGQVDNFPIGHIRYYFQKRL